MSTADQLELTTLMQCLNEVEIPAVCIDEALGSIAVPAALFMMLGAQTIMGGMFLGVLSVGLRRR
jgi:hypothetical protein